MRKKFGLILLLGLFCFLLQGTCADGQTCLPTPNEVKTVHASSGKLPSFEVATVKPAQQDNYKPIGLYVYPGGRVYAGQSTFKDLVRYAFSVGAFQIEGGPDWTDRDLFEISALPPDSSPSRKTAPKFINESPTNEQRSMLQALLIQRFGLQFHCASKETQVFYLVRGTSPLILQPTQHDIGFPMFVIGGYGNGMTGQDVSMAFVAAQLSRNLGSPVVDQTGLHGPFDFKLSPTSENNANESRNDFLDGIFQSVARLGLKLKAGKAQVQTIVIDSVTKPTEN